MRTRLRFILAAGVLLAAASWLGTAYGAGTVVTTEQVAASVKCIEFAWTSDGSGDATATTTAYYDGRLLAVQFVPDGVTTPSNGYDVTLSDANGYDVLHGLGADCSDSATVYKTTEDKLGAVSESKLSLTVANAGDTKKGVVVLWIR